MGKSDPNCTDEATINRLANENVSLLTEVSELREAVERATGHSSRITGLLRELADVSVQGLIILGERNIEFCNERARELNGVPEHILAEGKPWMEFFQFQLNRGDFGEGPEAQEFFQDLIENFEKREIMQVERKAGNGRTIRSDRIPNSIGGMTLTLTDITELKEREEELEASMKAAKMAERAKSDFLANMSHEIRTPMNGVMGMAELLAATDLDKKQMMFTDVIVKSGASLLTIINDILDFSKIDSGQMELDPAPFSLTEAIEDVATLVSAKVAEKDLELIVRTDPELPNVLVGDVGRIRQIATNLMGNAVKFTEKGHVYVNITGNVVEADSEEVARLRIEVQDTGIGIAQEKLASVFDKFAQVDTSATRRHEGTGLGLSISSSLVNLMGGKIGAESKLGEGSLFWFEIELPVHPEQFRQRPIPRDLTGARILIIDDNEVNRSILSEQMANWKFDHASCESGEIGLDVMRTAISNGMKPDLLILDYQMPGMSGAEVLEVMHSDDELCDVPVITLTSVDSGKINSELRALGSRANLTKPSRSTLLLETIIETISDNRELIAMKRDAPSKQSSVNADPVIAATGSNRLDVLVAEDNEVNQTVIRQVLAQTNLNFRIVPNGRLAIKEVKMNKPKLVLMDVSMPEMNGKDATLAIRKHERQNNLARTPIIGVTAHALRGDMEACLDAGMDDYLSKPVSPSFLTSKIDWWLKKIDAEKQKAG